MRDWTGGWKEGRTDGNYGCCGSGAIPKKGREVYKNPLNTVLSYRPHPPVTARARNLSYFYRVTCLRPRGVTAGLKTNDVQYAAIARARFRECSREDK